MVDANICTFLVKFSLFDISIIYVLITLAPLELLIEGLYDLFVSSLAGYRKIALQYILDWVIDVLLEFKAEKNGYLIRFPNPLLKLLKVRELGYLMNLLEEVFRLSSHS